MLRALLVLGLSIGLVGCGGDDSTDKKKSSAPATCTTAQSNNTRCSGTIVQQCNGATWATVQNCTSTSQVCTTTGTTAACTTPVSTTCTSAETDFERCNNNSIELCNGTNWVASQNCTTTSQVCTPSGNAAICEAGGIDSAGFYPYPACDANTACASGNCTYFSETVGTCLGLCNDDSSACGDGFSCQLATTDDSVCVKNCASETDCAGSPTDMHCCDLDLGVCMPDTLCWSANLPAEWTCGPSYYDADDGCDCGCGVADPDCAGAGCTTPGCGQAACEWCYDADGAGIECPAT